MGPMFAVLRMLVLSDVADENLDVGAAGREVYDAVAEVRASKPHHRADVCIDMLVLHATTSATAPQPKALTDFIIGVAKRCRPEPTDVVRAMFRRIYDSTGDLAVESAGQDADMYVLWDLMQSVEFRTRPDAMRALWVPGVVAVASVAEPLAAHVPVTHVSVAAASTLEIGPAHFGVDHICATMSTSMHQMRQLLFPGTHEMFHHAFRESVSQKAELTALALASATTIHVVYATGGPVVNYSGGGYDDVYVLEDEGFFRVLSYSGGDPMRLVAALRVDIDRRPRTFADVTGVMNVSSIRDASIALGRTVSVIGEEIETVVVAGSDVMWIVRAGDAFLSVATAPGVTEWAVRNAMRKLAVPENFMTRLMRPSAVVHGAFTAALPAVTALDEAVRHVVTSIISSAHMDYALTLLGATDTARGVAAAILARR